MIQHFDCPCQDSSTRYTLYTDFTMPSPLEDILKGLSLDPDFNPDNITIRSDELLLEQPQSMGTQQSSKQNSSSILSPIRHNRTNIISHNTYMRRGNFDYQKADQLRESTDLERKAINDVIDQRLKSIDQQFKKAQESRIRIVPNTAPSNSPTTANTDENKLNISKRFIKDYTNRSRPSTRVMSLDYLKDTKNILNNLVNPEIDLNDNANLTIKPTINYKEVNKQFKNLSQKTDENIANDWYKMKYAFTKARNESISQSPIPVRPAKRSVSDPIRSHSINQMEQDLNSLIDKRIKESPMKTSISINNNTMDKSFKKSNDFQLSDELNELIDRRIKESPLKSSIPVNTPQRQPRYKSYSPASQRSTLPNSPVQRKTANIKSKSPSPIQRKSPIKFDATSSSPSLFKETFSDSKLVDSPESTLDSLSSFNNSFRLSNLRLGVSKDGDTTELLSRSRLRSEVTYDSDEELEQDEMVANITNEQLQKDDLITGLLDTIKSLKIEKAHLLDINSILANENEEISTKLVDIETQLDDMMTMLYNAGYDLNQQESEDEIETSYQNDYGYDYRDYVNFRRDEEEEEEEEEEEDTELISEEEELFDEEAESSFNSLYSNNFSSILRHYEEEENDYETSLEDLSTTQLLNVKKDNRGELICDLREI